MGKKCITCGVEIPEGRLRILPNTRTCVQHSTASRFAANVVSTGNAESGEAFQEVEVIRNADAVRTLERYRTQVGGYR